MFHLMAVLREAQVPLASVPVNGAGLVVRDGVPYRSAGLEELATLLDGLDESNDALSGNLAQTLDALVVDSRKRRIADTYAREMFGRSPEAVAARQAWSAAKGFHSDRHEAEFQIASGMATAIEALGNKLTHAPLLSAAVRSIVEDDYGVTVETDVGAFRSRAAVVAVSPPIARNIALSVPDATVLRDSLNAYPFDLNGDEADVGVSIGVVLSNQTDGTPQDMMRKADIAL
jgi:hypothetical protein